MGVRQGLKDIREEATRRLVGKMKEGKIKPGFYLFICAEATFLDKNDQPLHLWLHH
jgi:hypothetical protein